MCSSRWITIFALIVLGFGLTVYIIDKDSPRRLTTSAAATEEKNRFEIIHSETKPNTSSGESLTEFDIIRDTKSGACILFAHDDFNHTASVTTLPKEACSK